MENSAEANESRKEIANFSYWWMTGGRRWRNHGNA